MMNQENILNLLNGHSDQGDPNRGIEYEDILFAQFLGRDQQSKDELWQNLHAVLVSLWDEKNTEAFSRATTLICRLALMPVTIEPPLPLQYFEFIDTNEPDIDETNDDSLSLAMNSLRILQLFELRTSQLYWQSKFSDSIVTLRLSRSPFAAYCFLYATLGLLKAEGGLKSGELLNVLLSSIEALKMPKLELYSILTELKGKMQNDTLVQIVKDEYLASMDIVDVSHIDGSSSYSDNADLLKKVINLWLEDMGEVHVEYHPPLLQTPRQVLSRNLNTHLEMIA